MTFKNQKEMKYNHLQSEVNKVTSIDDYYYDAEPGAIIIEASYQNPAGDNTLGSDTCGEYKSYRVKTWEDWVERYIDDTAMNIVTVEPDEFIIVTYRIAADKYLETHIKECLLSFLQNTTEFEVL